MRLFKLFIFLVLLSFKGFAQTIPNIGFEDGTFNYWSCYTGGIDANGNINVSPTSPIGGLFTIIDKSSAKVLDQYGGFPILCPNGSNYCIKLNDNSSNKKAQRVTYTFTAPSSGAYSIIFNYAVVLDNPTHLSYQQPKFTALVYDVTDDKYIECPAFDFVAGSALPGFTLSKIPGPQNSTVFYKDWSTATIDLRGYPNKVIRLEFTVNDCTMGGHFGYAYIDVEDSNASSPITGNSYCIGQKSITLYGPTGFASYHWYNADLTKQLGHEGPSLPISPPPPDLTQYALIVSPYPGLGCVDTLYTVVNKINSGFKLVVPDTLSTCPGTSADLTAPAVTAGSSSDMSFSYFRDSLATSYLYNPNAIDTAGTYYIRGINSEGCMNILPVTIVFRGPVITVNNPAPVDFPVTVDISKAVVQKIGLTYSYYTDAAASVPLTNYTAVKYGGTYYVKGVSATGCPGIYPINVVIHPPPPYTITSPNTFTPNNDGVNDHFSLAFTGYVVFGTLRIYNRSGQLVFTGKSPAEYWDGNYNGRNLPAGAYYWVFEGEDDYNNVKINKGGSITLVR